MRQNVDQHEIAKFDALAESWWDLKGQSRPLHLINPLRLEYIQQCCNGLFGKKVLDVGCGGGILTESMAQTGADVTGLDMGKEALQVARLHALETGVKVTYVQDTAENHALENVEQYDVVTCMEMLEHVPTPASVVRACATLVKPNGHVFFSTINRNSKAWFMMIIGAEYIARMVPKGTHDANKFIRPSELIKWSNKVGLQEKDIIGLHYNPVLRNFKLAPGVDVNYMIYSQKTS